jgi:hypothetical protein
VISFKWVKRTGFRPAILCPCNMDEMENMYRNGKLGWLASVCFAIAYIFIFYCAYRYFNSQHNNTANAFRVELMWKHSPALEILFSKFGREIKKSKCINRFYWMGLSSGKAGFIATMNVYRAFGSGWFHRQDVTSSGKPPRQHRGHDLSITWTIQSRTMIEH